VSMCLGVCFIMCLGQLSLVFNWLVFCYGL
jgi:hypothetical protein